MSLMDKLMERYTTAGVSIDLVMDRRADTAMRMIERWGMIMGVPDGEDSVGRQVLRLMTPEELVERAANVADTAYSTFLERGWLDPRERSKKWSDAIPDLSAYRNEITHECPAPGESHTPCCGRMVFELQKTDRMTAYKELVTCGQCPTCRGLGDAGDEELPCKDCSGTGKR